MAMVRLIRYAALLAMAFAFVGCGAKNQASSSVPEGANFAPASSVLYVSAVSDPSSDQWQKIDALLSKFPGRAKLIASLKKDLAKDGLTWEGDFKPALGDEVDLVLLSYKDADHNYVFFTKPKDEAKFNKVLESGGPQDRQVHTKIDGWTVFADNQKSLDNFAAAHSGGNSLSDEETFKDAMAGLPDDSVVRGYLPGQAIADAIEKEAASQSDAQSFKQLTDSFGKLRYVSFSSAAQDEGVAVQAAVETDQELKTGTYDAELDGTLPAGALFYMSFGDLRQAFDEGVDNASKQSPQFRKQLAQIQQALGFDLKDDVAPIFSKEGALAVYNGPTPEVVLALRTDDEVKATKLIDRLAAFAGLAGIPAKPVLVGDAKGKSFSYPEEDLTITAVVGDGKVFVSNSRAVIEDALGDGKKLSDDEVYKEALDASSVPDETSGFFYANLKLSLPLILGLANSMSEFDSPEAIPPDVRANIKPLRSALLYSKQDGKRTTISGFLTIK
jgi:hypothetical protein